MSKTIDRPYMLRRVGASLYIRIPIEFVRANNLRPHDYLLLDSSKFKILRAEDFEVLGREPVSEAEMAKSA